MRDLLVAEALKLSQDDNVAMLLREGGEHFFDIQPGGVVRVSIRAGGGLVEGVSAADLSIPAESKYLIGHDP